MTRIRLFFVLISLFAAPAGAATGPATILNGETVVPAGSYVAWRVPEDRSSAGAGVIVGSLQAAQTGERFAVAVLSESDFASWKKGYRAHPLYLARQVGRAEVRARLPKPDVYYVVVSNPHTPPGTCTVRGALRLVPAQASNAVADQAASSRESARRDLFSFAWVLALALGLALWSIHDGREAESATAEKRAA